MPDDPILTAILSSLIALTEHAKQQGAALILTMKEVAALRETMKALDPTFSDVLSRKREEKTQGVDLLFPQISAMPQQFDDLIRQLKRMLSLIPE